jgi:hypothetical protein
MRSVLTLAIFSILSLSFQDPKNGYEDKMSSFKWLIGTWVTNSKEGKIMETWLPMNDSIYSGQSTLYKKTTETVALETIQFVRRSKDYYFIPTVIGPNNNNRVEFKVTSKGKDSFIAENKQNENPKKISYILYKKDSLHCIMEGGGKRKDFYFGRVVKAATPKTK